MKISFVVSLCLCSMLLAPLGAVCAESKPSDLVEPEFYALYTWAGELADYYDDIRGAGFNWVRCGGWLCGSDKVEKAVAMAAKDSLAIVPVLSMRDLGHGKTMAVADALQGFRVVVADNVRRYGPGGSFWSEHPRLKPNPIRYWEIWNEPNIEFLTPPEGVLRTELYAELLKAASEEIHRLDPDAKIIAFNTAGGIPDRGQALKVDGMFQKLKYIGWRKFIRDSAAAVSPDIYDYIGTHPYTNPRSPEQDVLGGLGMIAELGLNKPVWFTEVGFALEYPRNRQVRDEDQQAAYMMRMFAVAAANGVVQVQVMYVSDIIYGPDNSRRAFGMFTAPGKWRRQAEATRVMSKLIPDPRKNVKILAQLDGDLFAYRFAGYDGSSVIMAWNAGDTSKTVELNVDDGDYCLVDMLGNLKKFHASSGKLTVLIGESPVYIVSRQANVVRSWLRKEKQK